MNSETQLINPQQLADDYKTLLKGKVSDDHIRNTVDSLLTPSTEATATSYPAKGSIASLIIWTKCYCTVTNGKSFEGSSWGIAVPGGGALFGDVYLQDNVTIDQLYANTRTFALTATMAYTAFYFYDGNHSLLGTFQAGSVSTVAGTGGGEGSWS